MTALVALTCMAAALAAATPRTPVTDDNTGRARPLEMERVVTRHDVVYTTPSPEPWEAMPTGGGDLCAMVRFDGALHLHLTKSDAWGFQAPPDAPLGTRFFNNVSPGHIRIALGPRAAELAARRFRQRLDLYRGRVVLELGDDPERVTVAVWGHPTRRILAVEVEERGGPPAEATVELSEWRPAMRLGHSGSAVHAVEVHDRAARPHLANTGMEGFFPAGKDPLQGRGTAVAVAVADVPGTRSRAGEQASALTLPARRPARWRVLVAASVTVSGDPLAAARRELMGAASVPAATLRAEHDAWWRTYWAQSFLDVTSRDGAADRLAAAYHVHLYTLGCVNRGAYPAKWDGGPGLMRGDERTWGLSEWVQEVRFTYLPLYAANHLEMARGLPDHYTRMAPYLRAQTERMWGLAGVWVPETVLPWGHAEDFSLEEPQGTPAGHYLAWDPARAPYGKFHAFNGYIGLLLTAGLELCQHYVTYYQYSGDGRFLRSQAYPMVRDVCTFLCGVLRKGGDGKYHLDPANALETWWLVRDPADTLAGVRAIFPQFISWSERLGKDADLRTRCAAVLEALAPAPLGLWRDDGTVDAAAPVYAPAAAKGPYLTRNNAEHPALYRIFPFGLSGTGTADYEMARRTYERRAFVLGNQWSLDPIWAARLGMAEEACSLLERHRQQFNRFRYGGWDANDSNVFPGGLAVAPFMDGAGLSAFGLQQVVLQSHGGVIRIAPAAADGWSGTFRLRAEGGFMVTARFAGSRVEWADIESLLGGACRVANPFAGECVVQAGARTVAHGADRELSFPTRRGVTYRLAPAQATP